MRYEKKIWMIKHWRGLILCILALGFFIGTSSFNYFTQDADFVKWLSPDEAANYAFAKFYGQEGELAIFEKYNLYAGDIMHPRSMRSDNGFIKPVSFLGIILIYGKIISLASYKILPFLTPFFAALGIVFYYLIVKKIFGKRNALISAFLLACFPVYIYYSARSMFHNVLFCVLLVMGLYYGVLMARRRNKGTVQKVSFYRALARVPVASATNISEAKASKPDLKVGRSSFQTVPCLYAALAGGFIGLAVITRTSELIWLAPALLILWIFNIKKVGLTKLIVFLCFCALMFLPVFCWNQILYGAYSQGGYPEMNQSILEIKQAGADLIKSTFGERVRRYNDLLADFKNNIFYFGFHPGQSLKAFYNYFVKMFYWIFWPAVLGGILFLQKWRKWKRKHWAYLSSYFIISLILLFYYGSWGLNDNPDPSRFTIGNSYTRYWLPIYMGALPFVSFLIIKLTRVLFFWYDANPRINANVANREYTNMVKRPSKIFLINCARIIIIILISFISIQFVLFGSEEGLVFTAQRQREAKAELEKIIELTENNSVIVTRYHDKLLFPERKVIVGLFDNKEMVEKYSILAKYIPVYYYNFTFPQADIDYLNNRRLAEAGLSIEKVEQVTGEFTLYKLLKKQ
ncbi:glycosyltransferase family 39 protein [Patescibacteria group bacterium]|nr:hypothetical protein [Candidatus Falkowbacteria bacterium]MBU3906469.1 glycosyltransferase family 39 protein [Patescibacteria group bacterium]MBU4015725.1 glycosyltransferase family 39 protein [Patescibacteria group bacterium]MBU4026095.1 glycosyltransferase family 39 protein [Patescibacteria group bacterium]MBU4073681.1 glycosyltransferase family 39 protein [Patescibacteria group bacterium]